MQFNSIDLTIITKKQEYKNVNKLRFILSGHKEHRIILTKMV